MKILLLLVPCLFLSCAKDTNGRYVYYGPSIGVTGGYNGISVGVAVAGPNPATPIIAPSPTPIAPPPSK